MPHLAFGSDTRHRPGLLRARGGKVRRDAIQTGLARERSCPGGSGGPMVITDLATLVLLSLVTSFIRRSRSHHQRRREQPHQTSLTASSSTEVERRAFWSLYLNDLPDPCDGGHEPIFLTNRAGRITGYICQPAAMISRLLHGFAARPAATRWCQGSCFTTHATSTRGRLQREMGQHVLKLGLLTQKHGRHHNVHRRATTAQSRYGQSPFRRSRGWGLALVGREPT